MLKAHPLTKLQLLLAILWAIPFLILPSVEESKQFIWFFVGIAPFIGLSMVTVYLGWLMVFKKEDVVYPFEIFGVRIAEKNHGKQATKNVLAEYSKTSRKMLIGGINIFSGLLCFIGSIAGVLIILRTL